MADSRIDPLLVNTITAAVLDQLHREGLVSSSPAHEETDLAPLIDHTLLSPDAKPDEVCRLCDEAVTYGFAAVCVQPCYAALAVEQLKTRNVSVASVVDFPHGSGTPAMKAAAARELVAAGVDELDMVLPVGLLKACRWTDVAEHISAVVNAAGSDNNSAIVKVILETCLLSDREKVIACVIAEACGARFVKTSTGYAEGGATVDDVILMKQVVGDRLGIKAAGGIRTAEEARALVNAGATRIGTSRGVALVNS